MEQGGRTALEELVLRTAALVLHAGVDTFSTQGGTARLSFQFSARPLISPLRYGRRKSIAAGFLLELGFFIRPTNAIHVIGA